MIKSVSWTLWAAGAAAAMLVMACESEGSSSNYSETYGGNDGDADTDAGRCRHGKHRDGGCRK